MVSPAWPKGLAAMGTFICKTLALEPQAVTTRDPNINICVLILCLVKLNKLTLCDTVGTMEVAAASSCPCFSVYINPGTKRFCL